MDTIMHFKQPIMYESAACRNGTAGLETTRDRSAEA